jgi:hypothetical protein
MALTVMTTFAARAPRAARRAPRPARHSPARWPVSNLFDGSSTVLALAESFLRGALTK